MAETATPTRTDPPGTNPPPAAGLTVEAGADELLKLLGDDEPAAATAPEPETDDEPTKADEDTEDDAEQDDEGDDDEPQDKGPQTYPVTVDGHEVRVTLDDLTRSYSSTRHTADKAAKLADDRKALDQDRAQYQSARGAYAKALEKLDAYLAENAINEPDWSKLRAEKSPEEFAAIHAEWQIEDRRRAKVQEERDRIAQEEAGERRTAHTEHLARERAKLEAAIPEWRDATKRAALSEKLYAYGETLGYTADQIAEVHDSRALIMLRKAMLYDDLVARAEKARSKAGPPTLAPGSSKPTRDKAGVRVARENFKKNPDLHAGAALIEKLNL